MNTINLGPQFINKIPFLSELRYLEKVFSKYNGELRLVGGVVRDLLQNKTPKDVDLATNILPNKMIKIGEDNNLRVIPTGLAHGTVTFVINHEPFEITTLRIDKETNGRHAEIEYTTDFKKDAGRRDLTINAMSLDLRGNLYDYFNGYNDLQKNIVRFVGDSSLRIQEDYLRILRFFRFLGKVDVPNIDNDTLTNIKNNVHGLDKISGERIWMEMSKIFIGNNLSTILNLMKNVGIDKHISLNIKNIQLADSLSQYEDPYLVLSSILDNEVEIHTLISRWKLDNYGKKFLLFMEKFKDTDLDISKAKALIASGGDQNLVSKLFLMNHKPHESYTISNWKLPIFPINGNDLNSIAKGPDLGKLLAKLRQHWIESNYSLSRLELINIAKGLI